MREEGGVLSEAVESPGNGGRKARQPLPGGLLQS